MAISTHANVIQQLTAAPSVMNICLLKTEEGHNTFSEQGITWYLRTKTGQLRGENRTEQELQSSRCLSDSTAGVTCQGNEPDFIGKLMWKVSWSCLWVTGQMNAITLYNKMDLVFCGNSL